MSKLEFIQPIIIVSILLYLIYLLFFKQEKLVPVEEIVEIVNDAKNIEVPAENVPELSKEIIEQDLHEEIKPITTIDDIIKKEDGYHTEWSDWSDCSKNCGGGSQQRERSYILAKYGGVDLDEHERIKLIESRSCNEDPCPINGYHTEWSNWGDCDKTCGGGKQLRVRSYIHAKYGGIDLPLAERNNLTESRNCNENLCPTNGYFSNWTPWSNCDKECGGGNLIRTRTYTPAVNGGVDLADRNILKEMIPCNQQPCPFKGTKVLANGERFESDTGGFMFLSPNGLYMLRWNNGLWFILYNKNNGSWSPSGTLSITSSNTAKSVVAGNQTLSIISTSFTAKTFAMSDRPVLYSAITDDGDWVFVRDDESIVPILKQGQNINISW